MERFKHLSTDEEKPKIDPCPHDVKIISKESVPTLILPGVKVTDNVGVYHFVTNILNGSKVTFGQHRITYTASDKAGNTAYCTFRITITGTNNFRAILRDHTWRTYNFHISVSRLIILRLILSKRVLQANCCSETLFTFISFFCALLSNNLSVIWTLV